MRTTARAAHQPLRRHVADRLRDDILEGRLAPGTWLRQARLAREQGVSQMPVREALRELAAEGLVEHVPYCGVRVATAHAQDVADLYACRAAIEGLAARAAAVNVTEAERAELRKLHERMGRRLSPRHLAEYRELNRRFHTLLFEASRRPFLVRTLRQLWSAFPTMLLTRFAETAFRSIPGRDAEDVPEHAAILSALERRDPDAAERAARAHVEEAGRHLVAALEHVDAHPVPRRERPMRPGTRNRQARAAQ